MLRTLLTRRWIIMTLVFAALIPTFYRLGLWQYHRYQSTNTLNQMVSRNLHAHPVPITSITKPGGSVPSDETYRTVSATGHYDTAHEFVIRQRTNADSQIGFHVITPLVTSSGVAVLVNRGWVQPATAGDATYPPVPPAPRGTVTVTGRLRPDETYATTGIHKRVGLPPRQYMIINSAEQAKNLPEPVVSGYMELTATSPTPPAKDEAQLTPGPNQDTNSMAVVGQGVHLPYAVQWWLFAAGVPIGWWVLFKRDVKDEEGATAGGTGAPSADGTGARGSGGAPSTPAGESASTPAEAPTTGADGRTEATGEPEPGADAGAPAGSGEAPDTAAGTVTEAGAEAEEKRATPSARA